MNFFRVCPIILAVITLFPGCFLSSKTSEQDKKTAIPDYSPAPFTPPSDSGISPALFAAWFACNNGLDSLSIAFANPATIEKKVTCDTARMNFRESQDRLCVQHGLRSGYVEYKWIMENAGNFKNKPVFDSMQRLQ